MSYTEDRVFVDTNILLYLYSKDEPYNKLIASELILHSTAEIVVSTQVIGEFISILIKKFGYEIQIIKLALEDFRRDFYISLIDMEHIEKALLIKERYLYSYWDSLIIAVALKKNCSILYSEDLQDNQLIEDTLRIINPFKKGS